MPLLSTLRTLNCYGRLTFRLTTKVNFKQTTRRCFNSRIKSENTALKSIENGKDLGNPYKLSSLLKCYLFAGSFCGALFAGVTIWQNEVESRYDSRFLYDITQRKNGEFRKRLNGLWNNISESQKMFIGLFSLNLLTFVCWKVPRFSGFMQRYFLCSAIGTALCWPMVLSTFSHYSLFHFAINMYVLNNFCEHSCNVLGKEQFLGFYLGTGVLSSLTSQTLKFIRKSPNPSLGASGAILGLVGFICTQNPNSRVSIVFLPQYTLSAENAIKAVLCLDIAGILFGWKLMDHAAHLGGTLFGILYCHYGNSLIWNHRNLVIQPWKAIKSTLRGK